MANYKITIEYNGRSFLGWQKQQNSKNTVQETIESALSKILGEEIKLIAAGRTDTGVNALNQVANFKINTELNLPKTIYSVNSVLPKSITIKDITIVPEEFHSRYSAKKREYIYQLCFDKKSIQGEYFHKINYQIDFKKIDKLITLFLGENSFESLCKNQSDKHNFICNVYKLNYKYIKSKNELIFSITANRFLHSMVRAIIGCMIDVGRRKLDYESIKIKFIKGEKIKTTYLQGNALFLKNIYY